MGNVIILNLGVGKRGAAAISNLVRPAAILTPSCLADFSTPSVYQVPCHLIPTSVRAWGGREGGREIGQCGGEDDPIEMVIPFRPSPLNHAPGLPARISRRFRDTFNWSSEWHDQSCEISLRRIIFCP